MNWSWRWYTGILAYWAVVLVMGRFLLTASQPACFQASQTFSAPLCGCLVHSTLIVGLTVKNFGTEFESNSQTVLKQTGQHEGHNALATMLLFLFFPMVAGHSHS